MLKLTVTNDNKIIYEGEGEGVMDILSAMAVSSRNEEFFHIVERAILLFELQDWPENALR